MTLKEMLLAEEAEYPGDTIADRHLGDGYTAFYSDENKELWDANHAIIYPDKIKDLGRVLEEIKEFYAARQKEAAIFHPLADEHYHYFEENRDVIERCGYELSLFDDYRFLALTGENTIKRQGLIEIKLLSGWDDRIANDIILPSGEPWELASTKKLASKKNCLLFVGFKGEKAVVYSWLHKSLRFNCVGCGYILTAKDCRGKGYASELLSYMVDFCRENGLNNCFHWAGPSERIVRRAGFEDIFTARCGRINAKLNS